MLYWDETQTFMCMWIWHHCELTASVIEKVVKFKGDQLRFIETWRELDKVVRIKRMIVKHLKVVNLWGSLCWYTYTNVDEVFMWM